MPQKHVVHTHSSAVNIITCCVKGAELTRQIFADSVLWVPYVDPGCTLAKKVQSMLQDYRTVHNGKEPRAIFMQNHGLFVGGDGPEDVIQTTKWIIDKIGNATSSLKDSEPFGARLIQRDTLTDMTFANALYDIARSFTDDYYVKSSRSERVLSLVNAQDGKAIALGGPLTPDQIVYAGAAPLWLSVPKDQDTGPTIAQLDSSIADYRVQHGDDPRIILIERGGIISIGKNDASVANALAAYEDAVLLMMGAHALGGINYMSQRDTTFIVNWEVEQYRKKQADAGK